MRKATINKRSRTSDTYFELVKQFPLKTIKSDVEHEAASEIVAELMGRELGAGEGDYLDTLIVLVTKYEDEHHGIDAEMTPREAVRALMEANALSQADIGRIIGSESAVSMFLNGERSLSKIQIKRLSDHFKVEASIFLD